MATTVTLNGVNYSVPSYQDTGWAQGVGNLSQYLVALASSTLQPSGGNFILTAPVNFGSSFGITTKSITFSPTTSGLVGTTTNNNASTGIVGEYVSSVISTATNFPATATYGDLTSISLTAGDWDVTVQLKAQLNDATVVAFVTGVSTTSGNSGAGLVEGDSRLDSPPPGNSADASLTVSAVRFSLSATTTLYLKYLASFSAGTPRAVGRISARRVR